MHRKIIQSLPSVRLWEGLLAAGEAIGATHNKILLEADVLRIRHFELRLTFWEELLRNYRTSTSISPKIPQKINIHTSDRLGDAKATRATDPGWQHS